MMRIIENGLCYNVATMIRLSEIPGPPSYFIDHSNISNTERIFTLPHVSRPDLWIDTDNTFYDDRAPANPESSMNVQASSLVQPGYFLEFDTSYRDYYSQDKEMPTRFVQQDVMDPSSFMRINHISRLGPGNNIVSTFFSSTRETTALCRISYSHADGRSDISVFPYKFRVRPVGNNYKTQIVREGGAAHVVFKNSQLGDRSIFQFSSDEGFYTLNFPLSLDPGLLAHTQELLKERNTEEFPENYLNNFEYGFVSLRGQCS